MARRQRRIGSFNPGDFLPSAAAVSTGVFSVGGVALEASVGEAGTGEGVREASRRPRAASQSSSVTSSGFGTTLGIAQRGQFLCQLDGC